MSFVSRRFSGYEESRSVPNIVIDGSPNEATVLTLTHWPGIGQPEGTTVDTSAEMAFGYLDEPVEHEPAAVVTNNHFDQDGAVGLLALIEPDDSLGCRELLIDLATAGDFGTYQHRNAARASMIISAFTDPSRSPVADRLTGDPAADTAELYRVVLSQLIELVTDPLPHRDLWAAEDEALSASEAALAEGRVVIDEDTDLDLAVVTVDGAEPERRGHRFTHVQLGPLHPMAVHNATERSRLLLIHGPRFLYIDRYETWVQLRSRTPALRVDLRPLAASLTASEAGPTIWTADAPSALAPTLTHDGDSGLGPDAVVTAVRRHLKTAPTAWDPYAPRV